MSRYARVLELRQALRTKSENYLELVPGGGEPSAALLGDAYYPAYQAMVAASKAAEELIAYLLAEFPYDAAVEQYSPRELKNLSMHTVSESGLMSIGDAVLPVAVVMHAVNTERNSWSNIMTPSFDEFAKRYSDALSGRPRRTYWRN